MPRSNDTAVPGPEYVEIDPELGNFMDEINAAAKASASMTVADRIRSYGRTCREGGQVMDNALMTIELCALLAEAEAKRYLSLARVASDMVQ